MMLFFAFKYAPELRSVQQIGAELTQKLLIEMPVEAGFSVQREIGAAPGDQTVGQRDKIKKLRRDIARGSARVDKDVMSRVTGFFYSRGIAAADL